MKDERGSASVLSCFVMLALVAVVVAVGHVGSAVVARHRAQAAADLGALAAATSVELGETGACAAARDLAGRMGGVVRDCRFEGWDAILTVTVPVPVGTGAATAAARAGPG
ncbi:Rv3654c family TadE-like protein [Rhodococcus sp. NPDC058505]|uniref:Rv3654c family TadE-like protein n=1 Tax=unclassified Rhodococcus (in: high G+C Gram-positive bacteria) TaxID=192944 RepID=UPI00365C5E57